MSFHAQISAFHCGAQKCARSWIAPTIFDGHLIVANAFLCGTIKIRIKRNASRNTGRNKRITQSMAVAFVGIDMKRPTRTTIIIRASFIVFDGFKSRQNIIPTPALIASGLPWFIIFALSTNINHGIDWAGATQNFATRPHILLPGKSLIRLSFVKPVYCGVIEQLAITQWHGNIKPSVATSRFQD